MLKHFILHVAATNLYLLTSKSTHELVILTYMTHIVKILICTHDAYKFKCVRQNVILTTGLVMCDS